MKKIIFAVALFSVGTAGAQVELSAEKCREMALENSYDIQIAAARFQKVSADQKAVAANFYPNISAMGTYAYIFNDIDMSMDFDMSAMGIPQSIPISMALSMKGMYMAGITLMQPIYAGGKITTGNKMAKKGVEMADENRTLTRMNVIVDAEKAYWMYVSVQEKVKLLESYVVLLDSLYSQVEDFSQLQMALQSDVQKVRAKQSNVKYELQRAKNGLELSRMALCHTIGVDLDTPIVVADETIVLPENLPYASTGITNRPEYKIMQKQLDIDKLNIRNTRADFLPQVGLSAGYAYIGGIKFAGNPMDMSLPMVMASLSVPIFHAGEGAKKVKSAKYAYSISELEMKKNTELMNIEVQQALQDFRNSFLLIESAGEAMTEADAAVKTAGDNYELRMGTILDVLEAQTQWQEAHSNLIEARTNCKIKETEYLKTIGMLDK